MSEQKRLSERITKGTASAKGLTVTVYGAGIISINPVPQAGGVMSCVANAELIAEAFNITNETGLSPKELKEQRDDMLDILKHWTAEFERLYPRVANGGFSIPYQRAVQIIADSFSKK